MNTDIAFNELWSSLIDVETYLKTDLLPEMDGAESWGGEDAAPIHDAFKTFRKLEPALKPEIHGAATELFGQLETELNQFIDRLRQTTAIPDIESPEYAESKTAALDFYRASVVRFTESLGRLMNLRNSNLLPKTANATHEHDAFISHASEDKAALARPLADALLANGHRIWLDEFTLKVGDSLRRSIDKGLRSSRFGIVILSNAFFAKNWTNHELDGLVAREMDGSKIILPIWHGITKAQMMNYSPSLADKYALSSERSTIEELVQALETVLNDA